MKPNKCIGKSFFKPNIEKYGKVPHLGGFRNPIPRGNDRTHIKQNKCMRQNIFKPHNENMKKCLIWLVLAPIPWVNDLTLTNFDGWRDL
jgi:hypothetical protein